MVTAAIAWEEIQRSGDPRIVDALREILEAHPDRAAFDVAVDRETGASQTFRMFLECARWPDDARNTLFDRPSWHASAAMIDLREPGHTVTDDELGVAEEAFELNLATLKSPIATPEEKAVALCWVMHIAGDIHQPLHAAQAATEALPGGDMLGSRIFLIDPISANGETITFHWYWDDLVHRSGRAEDAASRAHALMKQYPRRRILSQEQGPYDFAGWRAESRELAVSLTYRADYPSGGTEAEPAHVSPAYFEASRSAAEERVSAAGYRLADLIIAALGD